MLPIFEKEIIIPSLWMMTVKKRDRTLEAAFAYSTLFTVDRIDSLQREIQAILLTKQEVKFCCH